jgi:hypothetical protein
MCERDGGGARRVLAGIGDYREALLEHFGLLLEDDELAGIAAAMAPRSADEEVPRAFVQRRTERGRIGSFAGLGPPVDAISRVISREGS